MAGRNKGHPLKRIFSQLLAAAVLSLTITQAFAQQPVTGSFRAEKSTRPKLVVVVVIDQFRQEYLTRYSKYFGKDGFNRLIKGGANLTQAHYSHATTYTGPGHAQILSGSFGHTNGIIGNRWWNPARNQVETMFYDPDAKIPGVELSPKDDDTSPRNFIGDNLCDQLLLSNHMKSKAIGIALKDRAAIMLAGKLGRAYWFHESLGRMVTSTYYAPDVPAWVQAFNARRIPDSYLGKAWTKSLPEQEYSMSRADDFPQETDVEDLGKTFPHVLTDKSGKPTPAFYTAFTATPFGTDYTLQLAREAIENEQLGRDEYPDILGVSITPTDIAGHAFGPDSQEIQDMVARLDGQLGEFFNYFDRNFKRSDVVIALTSDHGATPIPEYVNSLGIDAHRIKKKQLSDAITAALDKQFGKPDGDAKWITVLEDPGVFLNHAVIDAKQLDASDVEYAAGEAALTVPGIQAYYTRDQFMNNMTPNNRWAAMYEKAFHHERSGDVLLQPKPFYFWGSYGERDTGSTHGSPYEYDTHVPLLLWGNGIKPGQYSLPVDISDLAPTLANILGVNPPAGNEGRALSEVLSQ
jgi:predicted AlkP superfamily pyrophosphatase or phosphodiesterase